MQHPHANFIKYGYGIRKKDESSMAYKPAHGGYPGRVHTNLSKLVEGVVCAAGSMLEIFKRHSMQHPMMSILEPKPKRPLVTVVPLAFAPLGPVPKDVIILKRSPTLVAYMPFVDSPDESVMERVREWMNRQHTERIHEIMTGKALDGSSSRP